MTDYIQPPSMTPGGMSESVVEDVTLEIFSDLGYATANGAEIAPDSARPERRSFGDVVLRLRWNGEHCQHRQAKECWS